jgi:hypothetical protein
LIHLLRLKGGGFVGKKNPRIPVGMRGLDE